MRDGVTGSPCVRVDGGRGAFEPAGLSIPSAELAEITFPGTPLTKSLSEFERLMSIDNTRDRLGLEPKDLWRKGLAALA